MRQWKSIGAVAATGALLLAACSDDDGDIGAVALDAAAVGDCLVDADPGYGVVDCGDPHRWQIYARFRVELDGAFDAPAVRAAAEDGCLDRWEGGVGTNFFVDTEYDFEAVVPDRAAWEGGERSVTCLLLLRSGDLVVGDQIVS